MGEPNDKALAPIIGSELPAYMKDANEGLGMEAVTQEDLVLPRLKLLQPLSPEVTEGKGTAGDMVNSLDGSINYGKELIFLPVLFMRSRIRWTPRSETPPPDAPKGMECTSADSFTARDPKGVTKEGQPTANCKKCVHAAFTEDGQPPKCSLYLSFVSMIDGNPIVVSMEKTKIPAAKSVITFAQMLGGGNKPLWAGMYKLSTKMITTAKGTFHVYEVSQAGFTPEGLYKKAASLYESTKTSTIVVDRDRDEESSVPAPEASDEEAPF